ncbi:MAG: hypothetical protein Q7R96_03390 [Nanoarchaeota archaeon]|nr:hypothetical protein [Nanoarchaeota archaeon]
MDHITLVIALVLAVLLLIFGVFFIKDYLSEPSKEVKTSITDPLLGQLKDIRFKDLTSDQQALLTTEQREAKLLEDLRIAYEEANKATSRQERKDKLLMIQKDILGPLLALKPITDSGKAEASRYQASVEEALKTYQAEEARATIIKTADETTLKKMVDTLPTTIDEAYTLKEAFIKQTQGKKDEEKTKLLQALNEKIKKQETNTPSYGTYSLALIFESMGNKEQALNYYKTVITYKGNTIDLQIHALAAAANILTEKKEYAEAIKNYKQIHSPTYKTRIPYLASELYETMSINLQLPEMKKLLTDWYVTITFSGEVRAADDDNCYAFTPITQTFSVNPTNYKIAYAHAKEGQTGEFGARKFVIPGLATAKKIGHEVDGLRDACSVAFTINIKESLFGTDVCTGESTKRLFRDIKRTKTEILNCINDEVKYAYLTTYETSDTYSNNDDEFFSVGFYSPILWNTP